MSTGTSPANEASGIAPIHAVRSIAARVQSEAVVARRASLQVMERRGQRVFSVSTSFPPSFEAGACRFSSAGPRFLLQAYGRDPAAVTAPC